MKFSATSIAALIAFCASVDAFPTESSFLESRDAEAKTVANLRPKLPSGLTRQDLLAIGRRDAEPKNRLNLNNLPKLNTMMIARRDAEAKQVRIPGRMPGGMPGGMPSSMSKLGRREAELEEFDEMDYFNFLPRELDDDFEGVLSLREALASPLMKTRIGMVVNNRQKRDVFDSYDADEDILQLREALASPLKTRIGMVVNNRQRRDLEDILLAREAAPLKTRIGMVVNNRQRGEI